MKRWKKIVFCFLAVLMMGVGCTNDSSVVLIEANKTFEVDFDHYEGYELILKNKSEQTLDVSVYHKDDNRFIRGLTLLSGQVANIFLKNNLHLVVSNDSQETAKLVYVIKLPKSVLYPEESEEETNK